MYVHYDGLYQIQCVFLLLQHSHLGLGETEDRCTLKKQKIQFYVVWHQTLDITKSTLPLPMYCCCLSSDVVGKWTNVCRTLWLAVVKYERERWGLRCLKQQLRHHRVVVFSVSPLQSVWLMRCSFIFHQKRYSKINDRNRLYKCANLALNFCSCDPSEASKKPLVGCS